MLAEAKRKQHNLEPSAIGVTLVAAKELSKSYRPAIFKLYFCSASVTFVNDSKLYGGDVHFRISQKHWLIGTLALVALVNHKHGF